MLKLKDGVEPLSKALSKKAEKDDVEKLALTKADKHEIYEFERNQIQMK